MTHFYAFLAGFSVMFISFVVATFLLLCRFERPAVRLPIIRFFLILVEEYFPAVAVIDIEGQERLVPFSALQVAILRIAHHQVERANAAASRSDALDA